MSLIYGWSATGRLSSTLERRRPQVNRYCRPRNSRSTSAGDAEDWFVHGLDLKRYPAPDRGLAARKEREPKPTQGPSTWRRYQLRPARAGHAPAAPLSENFGRIGRMLVALALVSITVVVLGKEPAFQAQVSRQIATWWETLSDQFGRTVVVPVASRPAAPASAPLPQPLALISDEGVFGMDRKGMIFPLGVNDNYDLPVVTGVPVQELPGQQGVELRSSVDFKTVQTLMASPLAGEWSEIHFSSREALVLYTRDAMKVLLLAGPRLERDLRRLAAVLQDMRQKNQAVALADLRYTQQVVVRPRRGR